MSTVSYTDIDWSRRRTITWLFVAPAVVTLLAIAIYPFLKMLYDSFFAFNSAGQLGPFAGVANYAYVLTDHVFDHATLFTVGFVIVSVSVELLLGLGVALLIDSFGRFRQALVVLSLPPMMFSPIVTGLTWRMLLNGTYGIVNYWTGLNVDWIGHQPWAYLGVVVSDIWMWTPLFVLVFTSTLHSIPDVYYEAGKIDGMNRWQRFKWITFPQLRTAIAITLLLRLIRAFKLFPKVRVLTSGGPGSSTVSLAMRTYQYAFSFFHLGTGSAAGVVYWFVMLVAAMIVFRALVGDLFTSTEG